MANHGARWLVLSCRLWQGGCGCGSAAVAVAVRLWQHGYGAASSRLWRGQVLAMARPGPGCCPVVPGKPDMK